MFHDDTIGLAFMRKQIQKEEKFHNAHRAPTPRCASRSPLESGAGARAQSHGPPPVERRTASMPPRRFEPGHAVALASQRDAPQSSRGGAPADARAGVLEAGAQLLQSARGTARSTAMSTARSTALATARSGAAQPSARGTARPAETARASSRPTARGTARDDDLLETVRSDWPTARVERKLQFLQDEKAAIMARIAEVDEALVGETQKRGPARRR
ncbi:hypothetical protein M885DRAFT_10865 [Pelagophyceae sp. CCMP2097]|nr:hypothetical protein M885DRAFT_10865 [Pelagophyceae sp. CCMP2097]